MEFDREYVRNLSLRLDVTILMRTVWAVLSCRGAY
jgi:lipopolysaccharide/colanic/teichoic acid biosynthesis glycosyltransferase